MKRYRTRWWRNIVEKQQSVNIVFTKDGAKIFRLLYQEENEMWNLQKNCHWMYDEHTLNTRPSMIDLQTGEIYLWYYTSNHLKFRQECFKMKKEYSKKYFDKFEDKLRLRKLYTEAVELYNWYDNIYDGRYDFKKYLSKEWIKDGRY